MIDIDKVLDDVVTSEINRRFSIFVENLSMEGLGDGLLKPGTSVENFTRGFNAVMQARTLAKTVLTELMKDAQ